MKRILMTIASVLLTGVVCLADTPSKEEFSNANAVVTDILAPKVEAMKSGKTKPGEVADYALSLIDQAETAVAKYVLAGNAYAYYMKGEDYAKAIEAIGMMRATIPDIPSDRLLKDLLPAARSVPASKAPEVHAIITDLKSKVRSQGEISKLKAQLKGAKVSERDAIYGKLGECQAVLDEWKDALENLSKGGDAIARVAQAERDGKDGAMKIAGQWWDASEKKGLRPAVASAYRKHASALYLKGLNDGSITGLNKTLAQQRVDESNAQCVATDEVGERSQLLKGCIVNLSFNGNLTDNAGSCNWTQFGSQQFDRGNNMKPKSALVMSGTDSIVPPKEVVVRNTMTFVAMVKPKGDIKKFGPDGKTGRYSAFATDGPALMCAYNQLDRDSYAEPGIMIGENGIIALEHGRGFFEVDVKYQKSFGNNWVHIAVVFCGQQYVKVYVNGRKVAEGKASPRKIELHMLPSAPQIGGAKYGQHPYSGLIDSFAVYDRELTAAEIHRLYQQR